MNKSTIGMTAVVMALALVVAAGPALGENERERQRAPQPNIVPTSWELEFEHERPRTIAVRMPGEDQVQYYWYMTYTVTNRTGEDQYFVPEFTMVTDAGDVMDANRGIPPHVVRTIKHREANPLLERPVAIIGRLLQGPDNARDGMAIWPMPEHNVRNARVFIAGLSGEIHVVRDRETGEERTLRKTKMIEYNLPGSGEHMRRKEFIEQDREWVVR